MISLLEWGSILLNGVAMAFLAQQLWYPYRYPALQRAWIARLVTAGLMTARRVVWAVHMETAPQPADVYELCFTYAVSLSLLYDSWCLRRVYRARLTVPDLAPAIIVLDADSTILAWNRQAERLLGWTAQEALGQDLAELAVHARDREAHRRGMQRWYASDEAGRAEARQLLVWACHKNGTEMQLEITVTALHDTGGRLTCHGELQRLIPLRAGGTARRA